MKKTLALIAAGALVGTSAQAAGISAQIAGLNLADGSTLPGPSKTMVIIDTDNSGIAAYTDGSWDGSSWTLGGDWAVVGDTQGLWNESTGDGDGFEALSGPLAPSVLDTTPSGLYQFASADAAGNTTANVGEGDDVYLFYFAGLGAGASAPGAGQAFGVQYLGTLPGPSGSLTAAALSGNDTRAGFTTAVPEPSSLALLGLSGLAMLRRRRG